MIPEEVEKKSAAEVSHRYDKEPAVGRRVADESQTIADMIGGGWRSLAPLLATVAGGRWPLLVSFLPLLVVVVAIE